MSSRSFSVGSYTRNINAQESEFDTRVRAFKDDTIDSMEDKLRIGPRHK